MALIDHKVNGYDGKDVASAADKLTGTVPENKAVFDNLFKGVFQGKYNSLIDSLASTDGLNSGASQIGVTIPGVLGNSIYAVLVALQSDKADGASTLASLALKADKIDTYTKMQVDTSIDEKMISIGAGDMAKSIYDPQGRNADIFAALDAKTSNIDNTSDANKPVSTAQQTALDLKADKNAVYQSNLLINGDFQVWQRGESFDTLGYTSDRWTWAGNVQHSTTRTSKGLKQTAKASANYKAMLLRQFIEADDSLLNKLLEKSVTISFSARTSQPSVLYGFNEQTTSTEFKTYTQTIANFSTYSYDSGRKAIPVDIGAYSLAGGGDLPIGFWFEVEWVKLEIGSVATPFVPRLYGEELVLCQRYYSGELTGRCVGYPTVSGESKVWDYNFSMPPRVTMRDAITPKLLQAEVGYIGDLTASTTIDQVDKNGAFRFRVTLASTQTPTANNHLFVKLILDAEFY